MTGADQVTGFQLPQGQALRPSSPPISLLGCHLIACLRFAPRSVTVGVPTKEPWLQ